METTNTIQERLASAKPTELIRAWLERNSGQGCHALARYVCKTLGLRDPRGQPQLAGVRKALRVLAERGHWRLPKRQGPGPQGWHPRRLGRAVAAPQGVPPRAKQVRGLRLVEVHPKQEELFRTWTELIVTEHPLHDARMVGRQLRYLIGSDHGWLGAIGFGACALRLRARDEWLGWDEPTRKRFQDRLINMTRFLIRPTVRCENLASQVLSLCLNHVGQDFAARYGFEPWLVESFVNTQQYAGTCYQAANWLSLGLSTGRGRNGSHQAQGAPKELYLYELNRRWRQNMGLAAKSEELEPLGLEESLQSQQWVEAEFGGVDLGHRDTEQRLLSIAKAKARNPSAAYTECVAGDRHQLKAYYRFIGHKRAGIDTDSILGGHRRQTIRRIKGRSRVLAIQDTTDLDFSERLHCNGLGDTGTNQTGAVSHGLKMHSTLALSEEGLPLGVLRTHLYASHFDSENKAPNRPIEEKESYRWLRTIDQMREISAWVPETELIVVGDRESDIFELFDYRRRKARNIHLLIRAHYNRRLDLSAVAQAGAASAKLFDRLDALPVMGQAHIAVPRQREKAGTPTQPGRMGLAARKAKVQIRWEKVTIRAPVTAQTRELPAVELHALLLMEVDPPRGAAPLRWVLLTTVPIQSRKQALRCLRWYTRRWRIEDWHRVLKSGCHIESHQHQTADKLARAIAIDTVMAWRVMLLTLLGRETPEMPCKLIFEPWECKLLEQLQPWVAPETSGPPRRMEKQKKNGLCIATANMIIARLGGALHRNDRELPGPQTILRGLRRFHDIGIGFMLREGKTAATIAINSFVGYE